jgi:hypothetical protein
MKIKPWLLSGCAALLLLNACQNNTNNAVNVPTAAMLNEQSTQRGESKLSTEQIAGIQRFKSGSLANQKLDLKAMETIIAKLPKKNAQESAERQQILTLMNTMLMAENKQTLNVQFAMSDEPVDNGVFVFTVESPSKQQLAFQMYDEEGFMLAANNQLQLSKGPNYKALNVSELSNGQYIFRLRNEDGQELFRKVIIENK